MRNRQPRLPFNIEPYLDVEGQLIWYAWPGCCPVYYQSVRHKVLCPRCANRQKTDLVGAHANWENPRLRCTQCNDRIESAYAEADAS
jgi:hypothetical protein